MAITVTEIVMNSTMIIISNSNNKERYVLTPMNMWPIIIHCRCMWKTDWILKPVSRIRLEQTSNMKLRTECLCCHCTGRYYNEIQTLLVPSCSPMRDTWWQRSKGRVRCFPGAPGAVFAVKGLAQGHVSDVITQSVNSNRWPSWYGHARFQIHALQKLVQAVRSQSSFSICRLGLHLSPVWVVLKTSNHISSVSPKVSKA